MRILITSQGPELSSLMDERFGRAAYFLIVDTESNEVTPVDNNSGMQAMQGAGIQSAQTAADHKAECVITGHVGPKAFAALNAAGITVVSGAQGTCTEVLERFKSGELNATQAPDVQGHW